MSVSEKKFKIGDDLAKLQARTRLSRAFCAPGQLTAKPEDSAPNNHVLGCNFAKFTDFKFFFTHRLSNKPFLIWLSTTPPHLKYLHTYIR